MSGTKNMVGTVEVLTAQAEELEPVATSESFQSTLSNSEKSSTLKSKVTTLKSNVSTVKVLAKTTLKNGSNSSITVSERIKTSDLTSTDGSYDVKKVYYKITTNDKMKLSEVISWYEKHKYDKELKISYSDLFASMDESDDVKKKKVAYLTKNSDGTYTLTTTRNVRSLNNWVSEHTNKEYDYNKIRANLDAKINENNKNKVTKTKTTTKNKTKTSTTTTTKTTTAYNSKNIYIDYSRVDETVGKFNDISDLLNSSKTKIDSLLGDVSHYWEGTAATLFINKIEEFVEKIREYSTYLDSESSILKASAQSYKDFDEAFVNVKID